MKHLDLREIESFSLSMKPSGSGRPATEKLSCRCFQTYLLYISISGSGRRFLQFLECCRLWATGGVLIFPDSEVELLRRDVRGKKIEPYATLLSVKKFYKSGVMQGLQGLRKKEQTACGSC